MRKMMMPKARRNSPFVEASSWSNSPRRSRRSRVKLAIRSGDGDGEDILHLYCKPNETFGACK